MIPLLDRLEDIVAADIAGLREAEKHYGDSWKKRGGVGAFMMLARKWDRLENRVSKVPITNQHVRGQSTLEPGDRYDIFEHYFADCREEGIIDDIRDLRRYLLLVEAEIETRTQGETK